MRYKELTRTEKRLLRKRTIYVLKKFNFKPEPKVNKEGELKYKTVNSLKNVELFEAYRNIIKKCPINDFVSNRTKKDKNESEYNNEIGHIYIITDEYKRVCKIGYSKDPLKRLSEIQTAYPYPLIILATFEGTINQERALHKKYNKYNTHGEWFRIEGDLKKSIESIKIT